MPDTYLELNDDVGVDADGNLEPIHEIGVAVNIPTIKNGELVDIAQRTTVNAIPGTRIVKTNDPAIVSALLGSGQYHETDAPSKTDLSKARKDTTDAREAAGTREEQ